MDVYRTDPLALAALATAAVPGLDVVSVRMDQVGADFAFAEVQDATDRAWVVRVPLHESAESGQSAELALLKSLAGASSGGALPFEVPRPRGTAGLDRGGLGIVYSRLPGVPVVMELMPAGPGIAESLGRAIAAFHQLPPAVVTEAGLPAYTPSVYRARLRTEVDDAARTGHVSHRLEDRWREQLDRDPWWVFTPVPIHGDMAAEHLFHHSNRISAMTDFASVQVSDPAEDLAQILAPLPPDLAGTIVGAYRARRSDLEDPHLEDRAAFLGEIAIIRWLQHGLALDDTDIVKDAREMLADLDRAVQDEIEAAARAAEAEAAAREKLEEAKLAAEKEAWERREAAARASRSAARERQRTTGSTPRIKDASGDLRWTNDPDDPSGEPAADGGAGFGGGPRRQAVSEGGVSVWGKPPRKTPAWEDSAEPTNAAELAAAAKEPAEAPVERREGDGPSQDHRTGLDEDADHTSGVDDNAKDRRDGGTEDAGGNGAGEDSDHEPRTGTDGDKDPAGREAEPSDKAGAQDLRPDPEDKVPKDEGAAGGDAATQDEPDSQEMTQAFVPDFLKDEPDSQEMAQASLPDFLRDESEAPEDIAEASSKDITEALERPR